MQSQIGRQVGVTVSAAQRSAGQGQPNTLTNMVPAQMHAIQYADDAGLLHNEFVLVVGDMVYLFNNGEAFAASVRPAAPWLSKKVLANAAPATWTLPKDDAVTIFDDAEAVADHANPKAPK